MTKTKSLYHGHRFPATVISHAVRWYFRFQLSLRDIEELLFERGVTVSYETIRRWCDKFGAGFAHRVKAARRKPGSTWHLDEMFVTLRGEPYLLWRAVDEHGVELDILLQKRRDKAAAKRFFKHVLRSNAVPRKIVTDQLRSYPAAKADIPELVNVKHVFVKAAARINNRAEKPSAHAGARAAHPQGDFLRGVRGFRDPKRTLVSRHGNMPGWFVGRSRAVLATPPPPCLACRITRTSALGTIRLPGAIMASQHVTP
jgi:putative transposase